MGPSTPFIRRPVATTLLTFGLAAAGVVAFFKLPVSPLPQVDFPTISVRASLPGASPAARAPTQQRAPRRSSDQPANQSPLPQGQPRRRPDPCPDPDLGHGDTR